MGAALEMAIPLSEMVYYYDIFQPQVSRAHFLRVVRAADKEYLKLTREERDRTSKAKSKTKNNNSSSQPDPSSWNNFPAAPAQLPT